MSDNTSEKKVFSLVEVTGSIQKTLERRYSTRFWVRAEMNKLNFYSHTGNCYPDILQKEDGKIVAQMRAVIWKNDFDKIVANFEKTTGESFRDGITIVFLAGINFSANHGLSLQIYDIDPMFTLGELELEKRLTILKIKEEGLWDANKKLPFPVLPKRLAVISVKTSKGYADFLSLLQYRMKEYRIEHLLFPSLLQGEKSVGQIIRQLNRIEKLKHHFDIVAIIRGGGGDTGLASFNNYQLASRIASFPLPIVTGIGHATNLTVAEMVAHTNAITPSELADLLLESFEYQLHKIRNTNRAIRLSASNVQHEQLMLNQHKKRIFQIATTQKQQHASELTKLSDKISNQSQSQIQSANFELRRFRSILNYQSANNLRHQQTIIDKQQVNSFNLFKELLAGHLLQLEIASKSIELMHPANVLKRGYTITLLNGKSLTKASEITTGAKMTTVFLDKEIQSTINKISTIEYEERNEL